MIKPLPLATVNLPDGQTFTVQPGAGGLLFQPRQANGDLVFPFKWTVVLQRKQANKSILNTTVGNHDSTPKNGSDMKNGHDGYYNGNGLLSTPNDLHKPSLQDDAILISPVSSAFDTHNRPPTPSARQVAFMVWIALYWYFQLDEPPSSLETPRSQNTPVEARPKGDWLLHVRNDGIVRFVDAMGTLERMGLVGAPGTEVESTLAGREAWDDTFVTRQMFWQIHMGTAGIFSEPLKTISGHHGPWPSTVTSIPSRISAIYPLPPLHYTTTGDIRHPLRPRAPQMGELFYSRFIPSEGKYLSFRAASLSPEPVPYAGPISQPERRENTHLLKLSDTALLQRWLSNPRVSAFWGVFHAGFLPDVVKLRHSFPVIGLWDGMPFGYFEIYWVKEDGLGRLKGGQVEDFDRGLHVLVGEEWARGRCPVWMSSLVHYCWQADNRTMNVLLEPRIDNKRFVRLLQDMGFSLDGQVSFPHKQSWIWFFDVSKQVFGSVLVHIANIFMSMLTSGRFSVQVEPSASRMAVRSDDDYAPNPCSFYLLNLAIDTTLGIPILIVLLRVLTGLVRFTPVGQPPESVQSGNYGNPPNAWWWLKQSVIYFCGLFGMKVCVLIIFIMMPWISKVGDWALGWTEGNEKLQIAFVMMIFPLIMNALQYYIIDSFIKMKEPEHERLDSEDPDEVSRRRRYDDSEDETSRFRLVDTDHESDSEDEEAAKLPPRPQSNDSEEYDPERDGDDRTIIGSSSSGRNQQGKIVPPRVVP
ncbi:hypothetical protein NM208_g9691 [Fusarium decemcellulare]|uniref:Uncharacterized protein n=1 Tax=Fusarium decemcellulare TaxID=57161 RepID=A0ACC1S0L4_9HYPO|nr:hypothetical protein NM208_g9691 [Fusarium decemcellulare]